jgi:hypothetical protein
MILQKNVCRKDISETTQENKEQQSILSSDKARTAGKGFAESKKAAVNVGISCWAVKVVKDHTILSRPFFSRS